MESRAIKFLALILIVMGPALFIGLGVTLIRSNFRATQERALIRRDISEVMVKALIESDRHNDFKRRELAGEIRGEILDGFRKLREDLRASQGPPDGATPNQDPDR